MAFTVSSRVAGDVATITLGGELDANSAPAFRAEVDQAAARKPRKLVLEVKNLTFMASAGLRVLIYAKQKLGTAVSVYVVAPQEAILDTLQKTGFDKSVYVVDQPPVSGDAGPGA